MTEEEFDWNAMEAQFSDVKESLSAEEQRAEVTFARGDKVEFLLKDGDWHDAEVISTPDAHMLRPTSDFKLIYRDELRREHVKDVMYRNLRPKLDDVVPTEEVTISEQHECSVCSETLAPGSSVVRASFVWPPSNASHSWTYCTWACRLGDQTPEETLNEERG